MQYNPLSKKVKPVLFITAALQSFLFAGILCAALVIIPAKSYDDTFLRLIPAAVGVVIAVLWAVISPVVRFRRYKYLLADDRIEIVEGIFYIRRTIVPIDRIHQIDITRGPIDNRFGVAKVTVTTAGAKVTMRFLELEKAEEISETLNRIITQNLRRQTGDDDVQ